MEAPGLPPHGRGAVAIDGAMSLIVVLLVVQMWLLTATLETFLAGHREAALPAAVLSGLLCAGCAALYWFVVGVDRELRP
jgi:predicted Co/Zn/Cd cation transporter (cation efflux family)